MKDLFDFITPETDTPAETPVETPVKAPTPALATGFESEEDLLDTYLPMQTEPWGIEELIDPVPPAGWTPPEEQRGFDTSTPESTADVELPPYASEGWTPPDDLISYLLTLISPPDEKALYLEDLAVIKWAEWADRSDNSLCGLITRGTPTDEQSKELHRVLKPGAHLLLIAPDAEPWGSTGACSVEDSGFEIRDAIAVALPLDELAKLPSASTPPCHPFHYVPKADRGERELGCDALGGKSGAEAVGRKEGDAGTAHGAAGAGHGNKRIRNFHPCLHPDALVMTEGGFRPISEIQVGERVLTADGTFHRVVAVSNHPYTSPNLFGISVRGICYKEKASDNHPFLIWRPFRKRATLNGGSVMWLSAEQIKKGDYTMTPIVKPATITSTHPPEWWFAFGLYLAEGSILRAGHGSKVFSSFTLHEDETDLVEQIKQLGRVSVYPKKGARAIQVVLWDAAIGAEFLRLGGKGAAFKALDSSLWQHPKEDLVKILEGWLAGDGGRVRNYLQAKTVSSDMASQMFLLGELAGYKSNIYYVPPPPPGTLGIGDRKFKTVLPSYTLQFHSENTSSRKQMPRTLDYEGTTYTLRYVKAVTPVPYTGDVWNLSVEGSPTFQTAVGVSHNTVKPVALMVKILHDVPKTPDDFEVPAPTVDTKASDVLDPYVVLDPFLGSGSTGLACMETGHNFRGMEREESYLEIATARAKLWSSKLGAKKGAATRLGNDGSSPIIISDVGTTLLVTEEPQEEPELDVFF